MALPDSSVPQDNDQDPVLDHELVSCDVCLKTIPIDEAESSEAEDYVAYYCGLDCYQLWIEQQAEEEQQTES